MILMAKIVLSNWPGRGSYTQEWEP